MCMKIKTIKPTIEVMVTLVGGCLTILFLSGASNIIVPKEHINLEVKTSRKLLNTWNGQTDILNIVQEKLSRVLQTNPEDFLALKEMARYEISAGYINSRLVQHKT